MGLDMYLYKRNPRTNDKNNEYIELAYWRKANQIHKFFCDYLEDGVEDCEYEYVPQSTLKLLLDLCKQVNEDHSKASELLPSTAGFFFGPTEYDDWYFSQIENTIGNLEIILATATENDEFYYLAWW